MSRETDKKVCENCGHPWRAHHIHPSSRSRGQCLYRPYSGYECGCEKPNPEIVAEDERAGALARMFYG